MLMAITVVADKKNKAAKKDSLTVSARATVGLDQKQHCDPPP